jgi:hypothetical protein
MKLLSKWSAERGETRRTPAGMKLNSAQQREFEISESIAKLIEGLFEALLAGQALQAKRDQGIALGSWIRDQAGSVKTAIDSKVKEMRAHLIVTVTGAVRPLMADVIEQKAIAEFCGLLEKSLARSLSADAVIEVPEPLHGAFIDEMKRHGLDCQVRTTAGTEVVLQLADTRVETRMELAKSNLQEALGA